MVTLASTCERLPAAPPGYRSVYLVYHPVAVLNLITAVVFIVIVPLLSVITLGLHGSLSVPLEVPLDIVAIVAMFVASLATLVLHELIHGLVLRRYRCRVLWDGYATPVCLRGRVRTISSVTRRYASCSRRLC
jgi:hypothetical protein